MRKIVFVCVLLGMGCETGPSAFRTEKTVKVVGLKDKYNFEVVVTRGNHSYIPINRLEFAYSMHVEILELVDAFQKRNPELIVTSFNVEKSVSEGIIYGLWLHHEEVDDRECCDCEDDKEEDEN